MASRCAGSISIINARATRCSIDIPRLCSIFGENSRSAGNGGSGGGSCSGENISMAAA